VIKSLFLFIIIRFVLFACVFAGLITSSDELTPRGVSFTWSDVRAKTLKIVADYAGDDGNAQQDKPRLGISHIALRSFCNCLPRDEILPRRREECERSGRFCRLFQLE
jgi:hypothetical protein